MLRKRILNLFPLFSAVLLAQLSSVASAADRLGHEGGAGGDGVLIGSDLYLIDLVEAGRETTAYVDPNGENTPQFVGVMARLKVPFADLNDESLNRMVALKLIEISKENMPISMILLQTFEAYRWNLVNHVLVDVPDEDTVLDFPAGTLAQLAIRRLHSVLVSGTSWAKLDVMNRTALIFHEAIYATIKPRPFKSPSGEEFFRQSSPEAREIVGILFSKEKTHMMTTLQAIGPGSIAACPKADNYWEKIDKDTSGFNGWIRPSYMKTSAWSAGNSRFVFGPDRDPAKTTSTQFCNDLATLYPSASYSLRSVGTDRGNPLGMSYSFDSFVTAGGTRTFYLKWVDMAKEWFVYTDYNDPDSYKSSCEKYLKPFLDDYVTSFGRKGAFTQ